MLGDVIALLALILSAFAVWKTTQFNKRQLSLIDSQDKLNRLLLEQRDNEQLDERKAELSARLVRLDSKNYRLKIFNKGKSVATDITLDAAKENEFIAVGEVGRKFPLDRLESQGSVELIAWRDNGTSDKYEVVLRWSDRYSKNNERRVTVTF